MTPNDKEDTSNSNPDGDTNPKQTNNEENESARKSLEKLSVTKSPSSSRPEVLARSAVAFGDRFPVAEDQVCLT